MSGHSGLIGPSTDEGWGEETTDGARQTLGFPFDLGPGAAGHAPARQFEALGAPGIALECRGGVVELPAVGFDDQAGIAPEKVGLQRIASRSVEPDVDLRLGQIDPLAEGKKASLELAPSPSGLRGAACR